MAIRKLTRKEPGIILNCSISFIRNGSSSANVMERRQRPAKKSKSLSVKSFDIDSYRADSTIGPTMSM